MGLAYLVSNRKTSKALDEENANIRVDVKDAIKTTIEIKVF